MGKALIIGAGAIGRGFLPWIIKDFQITFFDTSTEISTKLLKAKHYTSFMSINGKLKSLKVDCSNTFYDISKIALEDFDLAFICVGPRNVDNVPNILSNLNCPIFSLENDPISVIQLKENLNKDDIYFGVPDVITSSTASKENLSKDELAIHTENGILYLEDSNRISQRLKETLSDIKWLKRAQLNVEWDAKLYLHNTPHCIAAFLGNLHGVHYVHEALSIDIIKDIVEGVVAELLHALKLSTDYNHVFMESYAEKEVKRFSNNLLFDPINRVAREPIRKLLPSGRLLGALRMTLLQGVIPNNLLRGIVSALHYRDHNDNDYKILKLIKYMGVPAFLYHYCGLDPNSIEANIIDSNYNDISKEIIP